MPALSFTISPMLALLSLLVIGAAAYVVLAVLGMRRLRFRPAAVAVANAADIPAAERAVLEVGHGALEKLGFRYAFCLVRRQLSARSKDGYECFYLHTGFDAIAVLRAAEGAPRVVFRSYRPDGWSLETHPSTQSSDGVPKATRPALPRPVNIEAWTPASTKSLAEQWQAHLARFRTRAAGAGALLPEPGQLIAHEQHLAAEELARHVASGLVSPVSARSDQHRFTWASTLRRLASTGPRAQFIAMQSAGFSFKRLALSVVALGLCMVCAGLFYGARQAAALLDQARADAQAAGLPKTIAEISDVMSPTERRTLEQGAMWWMVAMNSAPAGDEAALLATLRRVPAAQQKAGLAPPPNAPVTTEIAAMVQALDRACTLLAIDLQKQLEAREGELFQSDASALAMLLRDTHWSLGVKVQAVRVQHYLDLLAALESHWLNSPAPGSEFVVQLHAALPIPDDLQRDAAAAYFSDKLTVQTIDDASPLARFLRDSTPLGSVSLAGHLRSETALWQAVQNKRAWSDPALLPSAQHDSDLIALLCQQPSIAQLHAQLDIVAAYAPRRSLCTAAIAAQMLMNQLPTPQLYLEPITRAMARLSGSGPGIEMVPDAQHPALQITLPMMPPRLVQWRLRVPPQPMPVGLQR